MTALSRSSVDRLGERLKASPVSESDLVLLDEYRRSFGQAYEEAFGKLQSTLRLRPTGRPAKSTLSIVAKLNREHVRLSQIQDIAGCRVVVETDALDLLAQSSSLVQNFEMDSSGIAKGTSDAAQAFETELTRLFTDMAKRLQQSARKTDDLSY